MNMWEELLNLIFDILRTMLALLPWESVMAQNAVDFLNQKVIDFSTYFLIILVIYGSYLTFHLIDALVFFIKDLRSNWRDYWLKWEFLFWLILAWKIFLSVSNPEIMWSFSLFLIDDVIFRFFFFNVELVESFILWFVFTVPDPNFLDPLVEYLFELIELFPPLETRMIWIHYVIDPIPDPFEIYTFIMETYNFLLDSWLLLFKISKAETDMKIFYFRLFWMFWLNSPWLKLWRLLHKILGYVDQIQSCDIFFWSWLLVFRIDNSFDWILYDFEMFFFNLNFVDVSFDMTFLVHFSFLNFGYYLNAYDFTDFIYLFNNNRYLMVRFMIFSLEQSNVNLSPTMSQDLLTKFLVPTNYMSLITEDKNWYTSSYPPWLGSYN